MKPITESKRGRDPGLTLIELLVVVLVLTWCGAMVAATFSRSMMKSSTYGCLNNTRQLMVAWQMYSEDNGGRLMPNYQGASAAGAGGNSWVRGWLDFTTSTDNTNTLFLVDRRYVRLGPYVNGAADLFWCPADRFVSSAQRARGWTHRARSYSANIGIGEGNAEAGAWSSIYKHITNNFEFFYPGPAETWVLIEEHPDSINDPAFCNPIPQFVDLPAVYHGAATVLAFADGHSELHRWTGALAPLPVKISSGILPSINRPNDPDTHWLSWHGGRVTTNSY